MITNIAPFDITPSGDDNPLRDERRSSSEHDAGGRHFDEPTIHRAAYAFDQAGDWTQM